MLVAMECFPSLSSAVANDDQLGPPFSLTLSPPLNQADIHCLKHFLESPLLSSLMSSSVG